MPSTNQVRAILVQQFPTRHVDSALKHYSDAVEKYARGDSEGVLLKAGKFVEAITKALVLYCGKTIPNPRHFSAGRELRQLENAAPSYSDVVRLVVPRACIFVYEIASNRGGRHDPHEIDANEMDANVVIPIISWILAEMVRFCSGTTDTDTAMGLIEALTKKTYPVYEEIDGRLYVNIAGLKPKDIALLLLYFSYPERLERSALVQSVERHGTTKSAATSAVHRLKSLVDEKNGHWKLRNIGKTEAEALLKASGNTS